VEDSEPLVARRDGIPTVVLEVVQELDHAVEGGVLESQQSHGTPDARGRET